MSGLAWSGGVSGCQYACCHYLVRLVRSAPHSHKFHPSHPITEAKVAEARAKAHGSKKKMEQALAKLTGIKSNRQTAKEASGRASWLAHAASPPRHSPTHSVHPLTYPTLTEDLGAEGAAGRRAGQEEGGGEEAGGREDGTCPLCPWYLRRGLSFLSLLRPHTRGHTHTHTHTHTQAVAAMAKKKKQAAARGAEKVKEVRAS